MTSRWVGVMGIVAMALLSAPAAPSQLPMHVEYGEAIRKQTTEADFLSPWVDSLPDHPSVPDPLEHLGYIIGAEGRLTSVEQIHAYFRKLADASKRARLFPLGSSDEGRDSIVLAIADERTLADLERYKEYLRALSDPRRTPAAQAAALMAQAKPIFWLTAGQHSEELGPPEMVMELAYRLMTEERQPFKDIRERMIVLITPVVEVDGRTRQVEWTRRYMSRLSDWVDRPPSSPPIWGKYAYHDNNRDAILMTQKVTRDYAAAYFDWLPTFTLDLHETVAFLYVYGGTGPYNEAIDATTIADWQLLSNYEVTRLTGFGMPGVWTWGYVDGWFPGYGFSIANGHNSVGRFFETFGTYTPQTIEVDIGHKQYQDLPVTTRQWYRNVPPPQRFKWSMRNNTNYMQSGVIASLEAIARNPRPFLENFYQRGANAVTAGREKAPHAYVIPAQQRDKAAARELVEALRRHRIELSSVNQARDFDGGSLQRGDVLVKLDQPYGRLAANLLDVQRFPTVPTKTYDDAAWTLGLMLGVETKPIEDAAVLDLRVEPLPLQLDVFEARVPTPAAVWVVPHRAQRNLGPFRFALGRSRVYSARASFDAEGRSFPAGSLLIEAAGARDADVPALLRKFMLDAVALDALPAVAMDVVDVPRIAMLHHWGSTTGSGWARFSFDQAGIAYQLIDKEDLKKGRLRQVYDVILVPTVPQRATLAQLIQGIDGRWGAMPYRSTPQTPSLGAVLDSHDITGGPGFQGLAAIETFVKEGGTLITLENAGTLVAETGMARNVSIDRAAGADAPGSIYAAKVLQRTSPLTYGYDDITYVFRRGTPVYRVASYRQDRVIMQFGSDSGEGAASRGNLVLSGAQPARPLDIAASPAIVVEPLGQGTIVMFGWNPLHRHFNQHDHAFLYNALLHWNELRVTKP